ncbi:ABC transporter ATP-binding protein [Ruegeria atlantica]|uniref:ABC transporter ATP-binding protein n=1 Tax=Ruegeria atlantica TaxID=81569 RepID=UPI0024940877|nr:ABC transporter ATP-binding protein [Ruegeria atlantica]
MLVQAYNILRSYNSGEARQDALKGCSFSIDDGDFVAITGPSGSGKSTLMNILGLLDRPTEGQMSFCGKNVDELSVRKRAEIRNKEIGFVFQSYNLLQRHTAFENVELPMVYAGIGKNERRKRVFELLDTMDLKARHSNYPRELSGGEQQRVAIARALANHPKLVLADEPTGALDSERGNQILSLFQKINQGGHTVVIITHDDAIAARAKRILRLRDGQIIEDFRPNGADELDPLKPLAPTIGPKLPPLVLR